MAWDVPPTAVLLSLAFARPHGFHAKLRRGPWAVSRSETEKVPRQCTGQCCSAALHGCLSYLIIRVIRGVRHSSATSLREQEWQHCPKPKSSPRGDFLQTNLAMLKHLVKYSISEVFWSILHVLHSAIFWILCQFVPTCAWWIGVSFPRLRCWKTFRTRPTLNWTSFEPRRCSNSPDMSTARHRQKQSSLLHWFSCSIGDGAKTSFFGEPVCETVSGLGLKVFPLPCSRFAWHLLWKESARHAFEMLQQSLQDQIEFAKDEAHHIMHYIPTISIAMDILGYWTHKGNSVEFGFRSVQWNVVKFQAFTSRDWTNMDEPGRWYFEGQESWNWQLESRSQNDESAALREVNYWCNFWVKDGRIAFVIESVTESSRGSWTSWTSWNTLNKLNKLNTLNTLNTLNKLNISTLNTLNNSQNVVWKGFSMPPSPRQWYRAHTHTGSQHQPTSL